MVTEFRALFTGANVTGGGVATHYTEDPVDQTNRQAYSDAIDAMWGAISVFLDEDVTVQMSSEVRELVASTGALQAVYTVNPGGGSTGGVNGQAVPRASQGLIRWTTDEIIDGRVLKGRTFVPGIASIYTTDAGGLSATAQAPIAAAAVDLIDDIGGVLVIWHRPVAGAGGSTGLVTGASVWDQFAVLRSRRD